MAISASKAKALCNKNELALVSASGKAQIGALSSTQLLQKIARARKLRDKWRDQAARQRRDNQQKQGTKEAAANARTAEKAQLFAEVLERFEAQLAKTGGDRAGGAGARPRGTRKLRSKLHRAERAEIRDELDQTRLKLSAAGKKTPRKSVKETAKQAPASKGASGKAVVGKKVAATEPAPLVQPKGKAPSASPAAIPGMTQAAGAAGLRVTKGQQRRATTRAKQDRLKAAGIIRIQKHSSSRNKRRQGRRDAR